MRYIFLLLLFTFSLHAQKDDFQLGTGVEAENTEQVKICYTVDDTEFLEGYKVFKNDAITGLEFIIVDLAGDTIADAKEVAGSECGLGGGGSSLSSVPQYIDQMCYQTTDGEAVSFCGWAYFDADGDSIKINKLTVIASESTDWVQGNDYADLSDLTKIPCVVQSTGTDGGTTTVDPTEIPYFVDKVKSETTAGGTKGSTRTYSQPQQFKDEGDTEGMHSIIEFDDMGIPFYNGDVAESNITNFDFNDLSGSYGGLDVRKGILYLPRLYGGNINRPISKITLKDTDTGTSQQDAGVLFSVNATGSYSLEKDKLVKVVSDRGSYEINPQQLGKYVYVVGYMGDKGGAATANFRLEIVYDNNGTPATVTRPLSDYLYKPESQLVARVECEQKRVNFNSLTGQWTNTDGDAIDDPTSDACVVSIQQAKSSASIPITGNLYLDSSTNTAEIQNPFGGSGTYAEYSFDGGKTWQTTPSKTLDDISYQVLPMVKDSDGKVSAILGYGSEVSQKEVVYNVDISGAAYQATSQDGNNGWEVTGEGSSFIATNLQNRQDLSLSDGGSYSAQWNSGLLGYSEPSSGASYSKIGFSLDGSYNEAGEVLSIFSKIYNNRQGLAGETLKLTAKVVDNVTNQVLLNSDNWNADNANTFVGNASASWNDSNLNDTWTGTGNPITLTFELDGGTADGTQWFAMYLTQIYKNAQYGRPVSGSYARKENNSYIRWNAMNGDFKTNEITVTDDGMLYGQIHITQSNNWVDDEHELLIQYRKNGGDWVDIDKITEKPETSNSVYLTPYKHAEGIEVVAGDKVEYRVAIDWDNPSGKWMRIYTANNTTGTRATLCKD